jgi:rubrerythrin
MNWSKDKWICEDCGKSGEDWGAPDRCPKCGSTNMTTDTKSVSANKKGA